MKIIRPIFWLFVLATLSVSGCGGGGSSESAGSTTSTTITETIMESAASGSISKFIMKGTPAALVSGRVYTIEGVDLGSFTTDASGVFSLSVTFAALKPSDATGTSWCNYIVVIADNGIQNVGKICVDEGASTVTGNALPDADDVTTIAVIETFNGCAVQNGDDCNVLLSGVDIEAVFNASKLGWNEQSADKLTEALTCVGSLFTSSSLSSSQIAEMIVCLEQVVSDSVDAICTSASDCAAKYDGDCEPSGDGDMTEANSWSYEDLGGDGALEMIMCLSDYAGSADEAAKCMKYDTLIRSLADSDKCGVFGGGDEEGGGEGGDVEAVDPCNYNDICESGGGETYYNCPSDCPLTIGTGFRVVDNSANGGWVGGGDTLTIDASDCDDAAYGIAMNVIIPGGDNDPDFQQVIVKTGGPDWAIFRNHLNIASDEATCANAAPCVFISVVDLQPLISMPPTVLIEMAFEMTGPDSSKSNSIIFTLDASACAL